MMRQIKYLILTVLASGSLAVAVAAPPASAFSPFKDCPKDSDSQICKAGNNSDATKLVKNVISTLLWAIGAVAVIMIIIGGFKYVTSNGDSSNIQSAKHTILYSAIGLAVALLGQAVVIFVVNWLT